MSGPRVRTDILEVYVFRRIAGLGVSRRVELLQLQRAGEAPLPGTWQPVMGHIAEGETAAAAALREAGEEVGLGRSAIRGFWQLEEPGIYFLHAAECLMLSPGFAIEVHADWTPVLNREHAQHRWVERSRIDRCFLWPGQRRALAGLVRDILDPDSPAEAHLRINPDRV